MSRIEERLGAMGLALPPVAAPVAAYIPATEQDGLVYTSGQLPFIEGMLPGTGKVGAGVSLDEATGFAQIAVLNALAAVKSIIGNLDRITSVVKLTVFVASSPDFTGQPSVANGASELIGDVFDEVGQHVRSAVGVAVLPLDAPVELELIVAYE